MAKNPGRRRLTLFLLLAGLLSAVTVYAASKKKAGEACADDSECKGHCYKKGGGKEVCVDCSSSTISSARSRIQRYCKDRDRKCSNLKRDAEISEEYFEERIENGDECIKARDDENDDCWDGGDDGHKTALKEAEKARKTCYDEWNTRKSNGFLYTCSDSTYQSKLRDIERYCSRSGKGCAQWKKDDEVVDCDDIDDKIEEVEDCVDAIESLDSSCLPRLSKPREKQWESAQEGFDYCKEVLRHKKDKKLCK